VTSERKKKLLASLKEIEDLEKEEEEKGYNKI
jgi:hypothetical protein